MSILSSVCELNDICGDSFSVFPCTSPSPSPCHFLPFSGSLSSVTRVHRLYVVLPRLCYFRLHTGRHQIPIFFLLTAFTLHSFTKLLLTFFAVKIFLFVFLFLFLFLFSLSFCLFCFPRVWERRTETRPAHITGPCSSAVIPSP